MYRCRICSIGRLDAFANLQGIWIKTSVLPLVKRISYLNKGISNMNHLDIICIYIYILFVYILIKNTFTIGVGRLECVFCLHKLTTPAGGHPVEVASGFSVHGVAAPAWRSGAAGGDGVRRGAACGVAETV